MEEQKQKYNFGWPYVIFVGSLLSTTKSIKPTGITECHKISRFNITQVCYSQVQIQLYLGLMLCFCSLHHCFYFLSIHAQRLINGYISSTSQKSLTFYLNASIAADGEDQHEARECCSVSYAAFFEIVLTHIKRVNHKVSKQVNLAYP